jgi:ADP-heptose:LPS heptosyltransferase
VTAAALKMNLSARVSAGILKKFPGSHLPFSLPGTISNTSRILMIDSGDLAELLFFTPSFNALRARYPGCHISVLVTDENAEVIRGVTAVNEILTYDPTHVAFTSTTYYSLIKKIRKKEFDVAVLMGREFNLPRALMAYGCGAVLRVGGSHSHGYPYINCEVKWTGKKGYEGERALSVMRAMGFQDRDGAETWRLPDHDLRHAQQMVHFWKPEKNRILVGLDPGQGKEGTRVMDHTQSFLVNHLSGNVPSKFLLLPAPADPRAAGRMKGLLKVDLLDIEPKSIKESLALLANCDLFVAGNTDFFHYAVALGVPTIGLFSDRDGIRWVPRDVPHVRIFRGAQGQRVALSDFLGKAQEVIDGRPGPS